MTQVSTKTKTVDGKALPADKFAYVGDPEDVSTWHLPLDSDHIDSALKMFGHEKNVPAAAMPAAARKIAAKAKDAGIETKDFEAKYCKTSEHGEAPRPWIEIFRAGDYSKAGKGVITAADLDRVVRNYDPTYHEAPTTIGHPADDKPAYGWIDQLMRQGDTLLAREKQVDPKFDEARKAGKFKKRSAAFYQDENGQVTGLRHVAYLGAMPPEVKGLQEVAFNDHGSKFIEVDFGEDETVPEATVKDQIKAFFAELIGGQKPEPKTFSEADVQALVTNAVKAAVDPLKTQIDTQAVQFAEREKAIAGSEIKQRAVEAVNRLKTAGKWIPAFEKAGMNLVFEELAKSTTTVEFGEGDQKKKVGALETVVLFLEGLPKIVPDGRIVGSSTFSEGIKATGDPLSDAAKARAKKDKLTFGEALKLEAEEHPELTAAGASAGSV